MHLVFCYFLRLIRLAKIVDMTVLMSLGSNNGILFMITCRPDKDDGLRN